MKKGKKINERGFTLVELIIVIGLLTVIAGLFVMNMIKSQNNQKEEETQDMLVQVISAASTYASINPEEVKNLYEGYGYVDIPIGDLRDAGLLNEKLLDPETGENISDDEKVRVKLDVGDILDITFPIPVDEESNTDAWKMYVDPITIPYDPNGGTCEEGKNCWCNIHGNVFLGLVTDTSNYSSLKSKMYLMNNKEGSEEKAKMYTENYFDENGVNLRVQSCDVNPSKVGNYTITYVYKDPDLGTEKTVKRTVSVISQSDDVLSFTVKFLQSKNIVGDWVPIVQTFTDNRVNVRITEYYRGDTSSSFDTTIANLASKGYSVEKFSTAKDGSFIATFSRTTKNSDGSLPKPYRAEYTVVPNTYKLTFDVDSGKQMARFNSNRGSVSPRSKTVTYEQSYNYGTGGWPTPSKTGYTFTGWFDSANGDTPVQSNSYMLKLQDHTVYAHWTPNKYTAYFNVNGGASVSSSSMSVTYDDYFGNLPTASRVGYTFLGWFTSPTGGTQITASTVVQITSDTTYYAHWKANQYYVTAGSTTKVVTFDAPYGPLPSLSGYTSGYCYYTFSGWTYGGSYITSNTIVKTPNDHSLSPQYSLSYCSPPPSPPAPSVPSTPPTSSGGSSNTTTPSTSQPTTSTNSGGCTSSVGAAMACMQQNHEQWHYVDAEERKRLEQETKDLGAFVNQNSNLGLSFSNGNWYDKDGNQTTSNSFKETDEFKDRDK